MEKVVQSVSFGPVLRRLFVVVVVAPVEYPRYAFAAAPVL